MVLNLVIATAVPPDALVPELRDAVAAIDPEAPLHRVRALQGYVDDDLAPTRSLAGLLAGFGGLSLLLSGIGTFAVLSYHVARRTREIGVRIALGADRARLVRWVTWEGLRLAGTGIVIGLVAATALSRFLDSLLFEVEPLAPGLYLGAAALLLGVSMLAVLWPALRAARMSPLDALATEG
jgi:ABC-type antimicrobial peptide transport system permease subunit